MESKKSSWYLKFRSWTPLSLMEQLGFSDSPEEGNTSNLITMFNNKVLENTSNDAINKSLIRRQASRHSRNKKSTMNQNQPPVDEHLTISIFDLYHAWKIESIEVAIKALPPPIQPIFWDAVNGDVKHLKCLILSSSDLSIISSTDGKGRSPLHFACAFGHSDVVHLLLDSGADPNACCDNGFITPLMCATVNGNEDILEALIRKGANVNFGLDAVRMTDNDNEPHTALGWAVKAGNVTSVEYLLGQGSLFGNTMRNWETPLHEAAYLGNPEVIKALIQHLQTERKLGCLEMCGGKDKNTALHITVEEGHMECAEMLLTAVAQPTVLCNKQNIKGQTPLHLAALGNDFEVIRLLLKCGADVNFQDAGGRTALHCCIRAANSSNHFEATECVEILLCYRADINIQDENGFTPFHTAVDSSASTIVAALLKKGADLTLCNNSGQSGIEILVKKMPHAIRYIKESLDFAISVTGKDIADPECVVVLDFRPIIATNTDKSSDLKKETDLLLSFCTLGHNQILSHPLIESFLILKWERVMKYFWASFFANMLMVLTYSFFVFNLYGKSCHVENTTDSKTLENEEVGMPLHMEIVWYLLLFMLSVFTTKELLQFIASPKSYLRIGENYAQVLFIILAIMTIFPFPLGPISVKGGGNLCKNLKPGGFMQYLNIYGLAAVNVVISWILILLRIGKLPELGLYVQMLLKVVVNFGKFAVAYASIVISFALSFGILLNENSGFKNVFHSFLSTFVMMTGNIDVNDIVKLVQFEKPLSIVTYIVFTFFVLLVTVVLMNLLVGLAVSDIQGLREGAKVARLTRLVFAISQLESMLFSNRIIDMFPNSLVKRLRKEALFVQRNNIGDRFSFYFLPHNPRDDSLPKCVQFETVQILEKRDKDTLRTLKQENVKDTEDELLKKIENLEIAVEQINLNLKQVLSVIKGLKNME